MLRYINPGVCGRVAEDHEGPAKCFILLYFGDMPPCGKGLLVQRNNFSLTPRRGLPRMILLRRSTNGAAGYRIQGSSSFIASLLRLHKGSNPGPDWVFFEYRAI